MTSAEDLSIYYLQVDIKRLEQRIDEMQQQVEQLRQELADERQRRRVLSGRVDYMGWNS